MRHLLPTPSHLKATASSRLLLDHLVITVVPLFALGELFEKGANVGTRNSLGVHSAEFREDNLSFLFIKSIIFAAFCVFNFHVHFSSIFRLIF